MNKIDILNRIDSALDTLENFISQDKVNANNYENYNTRVGTLRKAREAYKSLEQKDGLC